jgi:single-strand DNA-binding protein
MSINRVMISGNLTRDAEIRSTQSGMAILGFGVAVNDRRKNQQTGEWEDYPNFVDCTVFGARGEKLQPYLTKGSKVALEGKLRYSSWESGGQRRSKLGVIVDDLEFMSSRHAGSGYAPQPVPEAGPAIDAAASIYDEDIPF